MSAATREISKKKLKHFLLVMKKVIEKILAYHAKDKKVAFMLKAMILFKREDFTSSKVLDYEVDSSDPECLFTFEKFI
jgi:hypothetical protein